MKAIFFGSSNQRLFGVHHEPLGGGARGHAVLLCYPGVQEYNGAHWVFRRFAGMLAKAGHHVLRFDYFGTGDSAGAGVEGTPEIWVENIVEAAAELRDMSGARTLSLVGMRLGAALALRACVERVRARSLVLWDPVVFGSEYLYELEDADRMRNLWLLHGDRVAAQTGELLGFPVSREMRSSLMALDTCALPAPQAERVVIVAEEGRKSYERLCAHLSAAGVNAALRVVEDAASARNSSQRERARLSGAVLTSMVNELTGGAS